MEVSCEASRKATANRRRRSMAYQYAYLENRLVAPTPEPLDRGEMLIE
jgi:hypothetical protein